MVDLGALPMSILAELNPFTSALVPAMAAGPVTASLKIPVSLVAGNSSELAGAEMERAVPVRSLGTRTQEQDPASIPDPASVPTSLPAENLTAGATLSAPAVFSDDVRITQIMLALADELADELRTINEAILLREFGMTA